mmetsp:Transcript_13965/g.26068  ORF Transcript_13965/g.26068 Transcript_13965/m.26068 type:complete len:267 (-) Transcript_13965:65-865(-)
MGEQEALGDLVHHVGGQDGNKDARGQSEDVPAVVPDIQVRMLDQVEHGHDQGHPPDEHVRGREGLLVRRVMVAVPAVGVSLLTVPSVRAMAVAISMPAMAIPSMAFLPMGRAMLTMPMLGNCMLLVAMLLCTMLTVALLSMGLLPVGLLFMTMLLMLLSMLLLLLTMGLCSLTVLCMLIGLFLMALLFVMLLRRLLLAMISFWFHPRRVDDSNNYAVLGVLHILHMQLLLHRPNGDVSLCTTCEHWEGDQDQQEARYSGEGHHAFR